MEGVQKSLAFSHSKIVSHSSQYKVQVKSKVINASTLKHPLEIRIKNSTARLNYLYETNQESLQVGARNST